MTGSHQKERIGLLQTRKLEATVNSLSISANFWKNTSLSSKLVLKLYCETHLEDLLKLIARAHPQSF